MNLIIDAGNTQTKTVLFEKGNPANITRHSGNPVSAIQDILQSKPVAAAVLSSVGPYESAIKDLFASKALEFLVLNERTPLPFTVNYETPGTLGRDRIAAAAGARCSFPGRDVLIFDLGTAITIDFISAAGEYKGGNISPGLYTRLKSLHQFTARLPLVEPDPAFPEFGNSTRTAIAAGVQQGILHELSGYMKWFENRYPGCIFVITGGDAGFFVQNIKNPIFALPDLVLTGLNHILEFNSAHKRK
ncbi:MAG: type III pantothenate kinase [Bacteroidales bacterium]|nr:type III pantothenate kinase [Bacteroidales bacterium]